jgi:hypothetical protein
VLGLVQSLRGRITWPIFAVLGFALISKGRKTISSTAAAALLLCIPVFGILGSEYFRTQMRGVWRAVAAGFCGRGFRTGAKRRHRDTCSPDRFDDGTRAGAAQFGGAVSTPRSGEGAGLRPLFGALVCPIPRACGGKNRLRAAVDATPYGAAIYVAERLSYGAPYYTMGLVLASAHAYWEGGWFGVCIGVV